MPRCYLEPTGDRDDKGLDTVRLWLTGFITADDDFFTNPPPRIEDLHSGLICAAMEIKVRLDPQLEYVVNTALEDQCSIELDPASFWSKRKFDLEALERISEPGIRLLNRGLTMRYLEDARSEIEWVNHEIRRLEVHCDLASKLIGAKVRTSFSYRPTKRVEDLERALVPDVERDGLVLRKEQGRMKGDEDEDEDMLDQDVDADAAADARRRERSRTPEPGETSEYNDYDLSEEGEVGEEDAAMGDEDEEDKENVEVGGSSGRADSVVHASWGDLRV